MVGSSKVIRELAEDFAPYAATSNIMEVITRRRERGLANPLNYKALETISIPSGNISRTLQALKFLGLINDDGSKTDQFDRLAHAGEGEYRELLAEIVRNAYDKVFMIVDPAQDGHIAIADAFRQFKPEAQRDRMVTCFLGMCEKAGIIERRGRARSNEDSQGQRAKIQQRRLRTPAQQPTRPSVHEQQPHQGRQVGNEDTEYRLIFAVIQQLPVQREWTSERRRRWLAAVEAAVDLMVEIVDDRQVEQNDEAH